MSPKQKRSVADVFFDIVGAVVPSCGPALRMVERAQERPLKIVALFYFITARFVFIVVVIALSLKKSAPR